MYGVIRLLIVTVMGLIAVYATNKMLGKRKATHYIGVFVILLVSFFVLSFVPFENAFITFESPEKAAEYYLFSDIKITGNISGKSSDLVVGKKTG